MARRTLQLMETQVMVCENINYYCFVKSKANNMKSLKG